jgi:hypothetical protein
MHRLDIERNTATNERGYQSEDRPETNPGPKTIEQTPEAHIHVQIHASSFIMQQPQLLLTSSTEV